MYYKYVFVVGGVVTLGVAVTVFFLLLLACYNDQMVRAVDSGLIRSLVKPMTGINSFPV